MPSTPKESPTEEVNVTICKVVNTQFDSNINDRTVSRYVREGYVGQSPLKRGPVGHFIKPVYKCSEGGACNILEA